MSKPMEVQIDEWLCANGHDLTGANDLHKAAMRQYAKEQIVIESSKPTVESTVEPTEAPKAVAKGKK